LVGAGPALSVALTVTVVSKPWSRLFVADAQKRLTFGSTLQG